MPTIWCLVAPLSQWISCPNDSKVPLGRGDRGKRRLENSLCLLASLISHKSIQWQMTLVSKKESSAMHLFASVYLSPMLTSTHMSLLSVLPAYCSGIVQHIWQAKGKAAVHCILFLLFKVYIPAKWILSEPKTLAVIPCYKSAVLSILATWRTKNLKAL